MYRTFFFRPSGYLKYLMLSRHRKGHGIHSPFIFDLISRVFRNKNNPEVVRSIERIRKINISDNRLLLVSDLGAGSEKMKSKFRKVSGVVKNSAVPKKYGILLLNMAREFGNKVIVEFGTSCGISTMYFAKSSSQNFVHTMEGCNATAEIARENFMRAGIDNIKLHNGSFDEIVPELLKENIKPGLIFIDGNHRKDPVLKYFSQMLQLSDSETVIILDDIHHSEEMEEAWNEIRKHEKVSFTIDIYRMGLVFFRKGMHHFDYVIRY